MSNTWIIVNLNELKYLKENFDEAGKALGTFGWTDKIKDADTFSDWSIAARTRDGLGLNGIAMVRRKSDC